MAAGPVARNRATANAFSEALGRSAKVSSPRAASQQSNGAAVQPQVDNALGNALPDAVAASQQAEQDVAVSVHQFGQTFDDQICPQLQRPANGWTGQ